jgi:hypothetical protein
MGILEAAEPAVIICTRNRNRATAFYRDTLGLVMTYEDHLAAVFNISGITLRISTVADFSPHEHTILGFRTGCAFDRQRVARERRDLQCLYKLPSG